MNNKEFFEFEAFLLFLYLRERKETSCNAFLWLGLRP